MSTLNFNSDIFMIELPCNENNKEYSNFDENDI